VRDLHGLESIWVLHERENAAFGYRIGEIHFADEAV
jgi:hypothetical protein